ncbi:NADH-ubiquinone oxidoreductase B12 subunit family-domain-containing protein [Vararia minispora EC-137]|uniref:NADH-ubiquinone oxidoreductase B12 subunit family-domain-containing protein n=1 Tax=Vararia minispora EC-137 TaxID=1314806 RepID=A0ACB8QE84_9AGAM|nr:NADH-ubiquinone oxidoreductase B12 subunit family-domain-containing protein [Vararia minispora EC-137]
MSEGPQLYRDPWAKYNAWRKHPVFARRAMFSAMFPGFGIAAVAFTTYVIADNLIFSTTKEVREAEERHKRDHH